jgi:hypothetical protein
MIVTAIALAAALTNANAADTQITATSFPPQLPIVNPVSMESLASAGPRIPTPTGNSYIRGIGPNHGPCVLHNVMVGPGDAHSYMQRVCDPFAEGNEQAALKAAGPGASIVNNDGCIMFGWVYIHHNVDPVANMVPKKCGLKYENGRTVLYRQFPGSWYKTPFYDLRAPY